MFSFYPSIGTNTNNNGLLNLSGILQGLTNSSGTQQSSGGGASYFGYLPQPLPEPIDLTGLTGFQIAPLGSIMYGTGATPAGTGTQGKGQFSWNMPWQSQKSATPTTTATTGTSEAAISPVTALASLFNPYFSLSNLIGNAGLNMGNAGLNMGNAGLNNLSQFILPLLISRLLAGSMGLRSAT